MSFFDKAVYISIAIFYNLFVHHLVNSFYKTLPFEEKFNKSTTFIFIAGIFGIVLSKIFLKDEQSYTNSVLSMGFGIGGILLMLTAVWVNWENLSDDIKLCLSAFAFGLIIWYAHRYDTKKDEDEDEDSSS